MPDLADVPGITELRALIRGDPRVRVAMVDGHVDTSHPSLDGVEITEIATPWLTEAAPVEGGDEKHATWVASVLFGKPGSTVEGLAPDCTALSIPALSNEDSFSDPLGSARTIEAAVRAGAHIVVLEHCLPTRSDDVDTLLASAVAQAEEAGVLLIAAAGNDKSECRCYPASFPEVLAVGAYDDDGIMYKFSNWGAEYLPTAIVAPGGNMPGAEIGGGVARHKGTCCSAALVTGVAALLVSLQLKQGGKPDPLAVRQALLDSAQPCTAEDAHGDVRRCLAGKLNVPGATRLIRRDGLGGPGVVTSAARRRGSGKVYALGTVGYDFGTEARRDTFKQLMAPATVGESAVPANPYDARQMADHLDTHPTEAHSLIWTLNLELNPIYALQATGAYAAEVYRRLNSLLRGEIQDESADDYIDRVSIPGTLTARTVTLFSGQVIPVVEVDQTRGLYGWKTNTLLDAAIAAAQSLPGDAPATDIRRTLREFLTRVYYDLRNLGQTSRDRALNFAATNAFQAVNTIAAAVTEGRALDTITVEKSPFCRMNSDCWDVKLRFFDPENGLRARKVFRFTIDVSDSLPVTVGDIRTWAEAKR